jgi:hypothetical protein
MVEGEPFVATTVLATMLIPTQDFPAIYGRHFPDAIAIGFGQANLFGDKQD